MRGSVFVRDVVEKLARMQQQFELALDPIASIGVDWITATHQVGYSPDWFDATSDWLLCGEWQRDNFARPFSIQGYQGIKCGQAFIGTRADGCMVQVTGESAQYAWRRVAQYADNVPRLDLQATIRLTSDAYSFVRRVDQNFRRAKKRKGRGPTVRFERSENGGATAYIGRKCSRRYGKVYNKWAESRQERFRNCVRYELTLREDLGRWASASILRHFDERCAIAELVSSYFSEVGSRPPSVLLDQASTSPAFPTRFSRSVSDVAQSLAWLSVQVRPTVERLISAGYRDSVVQVLGLSVESETTINIGGEM